MRFSARRKSSRWQRLMAQQPRVDRGLRWQWQRQRLPLRLRRGMLLVGRRHIELREVRRRRNTRKGGDRERLSKLKGERGATSKRIKRSSAADLKLTIERLASVVHRTLAQLRRRLRHTDPRTSGG